MREIKIMTTLKELKSFCKKNNIKCRKNKDKLVITTPPYMDVISKRSYQNNFEYETKYFINKLAITVYDYYYDDFNSLKTIYCWDDSQEQILGVLFLKHEFLIFVKSKKIKWDQENWYRFNEFRGEQNDNTNN